MILNARKYAFMAHATTWVSYICQTELFFSAVAFRITPTLAAFKKL